MRFIIELFIGKILAKLADMIDKNRGTSFAGRHILKLDKTFISKFKGIKRDKVILVTGTNGKSSTTNLLNHIFLSCGEKVISNLAGANLRSGIATCFIKNSSLSGKINDGYIILEVDERTLKYILEWIPVGNLVVTNIQEDQVQRNGCPEYIYNMLADHITEDITLYLNNDEPTSKSFENLVKNTVYYGVEKMSCSYTKDGELDVTMPCPECHNRIKFDYYNMSNMGSFSCTGCEYHSEPKADYIVEKVDFDNLTAEIFGKQFHMPYKNPFMVYNYAASIAVARCMGLDEDKIVSSFDSFVNIEGRIDSATYKGKTIRYVRTKQENPDTLQAALDFITTDKKKKVVLFGLCIIDDFTPFYTNTFYSYDCDFTALVNSNVEKFICFDETTCYDIANRLIYAGCPREKIEIVPTLDMQKVLDSFAECESDNGYIITRLYSFHAAKAVCEQQDKGQVQ